MDPHRDTPTVFSSTQRSVRVPHYEHLNKQKSQSYFSCRTKLTSAGTPPRLASRTLARRGRGCLTFTSPFGPSSSAATRLQRLILSAAFDISYPEWFSARRPNIVTSLGVGNCVVGDVCPTGRSVLQPTVRFGPNQVMPSRPDPRRASAPSQHAWHATGPLAARYSFFPSSLLGCFCFLLLLPLYLSARRSHSMTMGYYYF